MATQELTRVQRIENRINHDVADTLSVSQAAGGIAFRSMGEVMEFAKLMAISDKAVPPHLRNNPGACLGIALTAVEWRMSPFAVASKTYLVNDRISYESQLIHAVIEQRAPLTGRLRCEYIGQGESRQCIIIGRVKGEAEPLTYESPKFKDITPKNSPLWKTKPDLQLFYNASRDWARMYFPDVIMGVYAEDEFEMPAAPVVAQSSRSAVKQFNEQLPDTQLTDAEAEAIIQRKAEQAHADEPQPAEQIEQTIEPATADDAPRFPDKLPDHARADMGWLDDLIRERKPEEISMHEARKRFGKLHAPHSWAKVPLDEQDALYARLRDEPGLLDS